MPPRPLCVARIPVLHRRVFDLRVVECDEFDHRSVQLIFVALRRGAALQVTHVGTRIRDDQRAFELAGVLRIDAEVGRQLHRAAHALRDVDERAVAEYGRVERCVEVVAHRHDAAQVLLHEFRVFLHGFGERTEDHAGFRQLRLERGADRDAVEYRVDCNTRERFLLVQRNAELFVGPQQLRVDFVERLRAVLLLFRRREIRDRLEVDRRKVQVCPLRRRRAAPVPIRREPPLEQPLRLAFSRRDEAHDVFRQARRQRLRLDVGDEAGR